MQNFNKSLKSIIENRTSVRTFNSQPISNESKKVIKDYLDIIKNQAPFQSKLRFKIINFDHIPPDEKKKLGTYGFIKGAKTFILGAVDKSPVSRLDYGYVFEYLILKATELELGTCWLGGTFKKTEFRNQIHLQQNELMPAITPIGYANKRNFKEKIIRSAIKAKKRLPWKNLFFLNSFQTNLNQEDANEFLNAFEWVRLGPSAGNKQPWRVVYLKDQKRMDFFLDRKKLTKNKGYWRIQYLDIGIAMAHFELGCKAKGRSGKWEILNQKNLRYKIPPKYEYCVTWQQDLAN